MEGGVDRAAQLQRRTRAVSKVAQALKIRREIIRILLAGLTEDEAVLDLEDSELIGRSGG